jgi:Rieske Fe-S protein
MDTKNYTRREFLSTSSAYGAAAVVMGSAAGAKILAMSKSTPVPMKAILIDVSKPEYSALTKTGQALKIPNPHDTKKPIIVSRISETEVVAFSSKCTHWGCEVELPINNVIICNCHHSEFDNSGKVLKGPAKKDLFRFSASLNGNLITLTDANE